MAVLTLTLWNRPLASQTSFDRRGRACVKACRILATRALDRCGCRGHLDPGSRSGRSSQEATGVSAQQRFGDEAVGEPMPPREPSCHTPAFTPADRDDLRILDTTREAGRRRDRRRLGRAWPGPRPRLRLEDRRGAQGPTATLREVARSGFDSRAAPHRPASARSVSSWVTCRRHGGA